MNSVSRIPATGDQFQLEHGRQRAVVTEVGATLRSWRVDGVELLDTFGLDEPGTAYRGKVLMPWPNRLRGGRYSFAGAEHVTALTEPERGHALHGLVNWVNWRAVEVAPTAVVLAYRLHPQPGYPFTLELAVEYALTDGGLEVTLRAVNRGSTAAPFGAGFHPYIALGGRPADDARLEIPASSWLPVDSARVPAGPARPVQDTPNDFRRMRPVGDLALDTTFKGFERDAAGNAVLRVAYPMSSGARNLTVWMDGSFRYAQVYTGEEDPEPARRRRSVALEPMTCAPDAFNSGEGLLVLAPGQSFAGGCGLTVSAL